MTEIPDLKVTPDRYLTYRYAGASGDFNPIHIDEEFATSVGLPGRILHGLWTMSQVARAVSQAGELKRLEVQFRGMGFPEQEITVTSTVKDVAERGGLQFFVFESRSTNQDGETVCTGTWTNIVR